MTAGKLVDPRRDAVLDFAHALVGAVLNRLLHDRDSRFVADANTELVASLRAAAALGVDMPLALQLDESRIYHDGAPLDGPSLQARSLLRRCGERDIAVLSFDEHLATEEANRLLDLLLLPGNVHALARSHRQQTLTACGIRNVRVTLRGPAHPDDRRTALGGDDRALERYQDLAEALQQNQRLAHRDLELSVWATAPGVERTLLSFDEPSRLLALAMPDDVDRFPVGPSVRGALPARQVAREAGASRDQLVRLGAAALMHDIGKSKVPQEVLFKRGRLSDEEWRCMRQHPRLGAQILIEQHERVDPRAIGAAFCHHMGPAGRGYPESALPLRPSATSSLIRVCDVFEALTAVRPYKQALTPIEAYAVMFRDEGEFDPVWLRRFVRTLGLFPVGTRVQLADGAEALVVEQTGDLRRPLVRLLSGPDGGPLVPGQPELVEIGAPLDGRTPRIAGIATHDRHVEVPAFEPDSADGPCAAHACLPDPPRAGGRADP